MKARKPKKIETKILESKAFLAAYTFKLLVAATDEIYMTASLHFNLDWHAAIRPTEESRAVFNKLPVDLQARLVAEVRAKAVVLQKRYFTPQQIEKLGPPPSS